MNKAELIKELESRLGSRKAASEALTAVVDVIIREVAKGGSVAITGFGTFEQAARAARTGRNPRTGATVKIKKTVVPKFRAGSAFKDVVKNPRSLPKAAAAGARAAAGTATKAAVAGARKAAPATKATATKAAAKSTTAKKTTAAKTTTAKKTTATKAASTK
ncbi:HU family DNA-binding protein, partial [Pedococcus sp. NPDC057267]|uniref:HU family DNA-binding protein n=1 Tax=Pedococcus sp. NPDC057267 TaxID=3346077 RepID=UPI0036369E77